MSSEREPRKRATNQLPPGRHGLPRKYVEQNQRQRIVDAVADVVSLTGYQAMSVEEIVGAAGVSRRTFYDRFQSKEDAFLAAYDTISNELFQTVKAAQEVSSTFPEGVIACLRAFLEYLAAHPQYADACIVEVLAAGPRALQRRNDVMRALAVLIHNGAENVAGSMHPPALTAETIVGGIYEIVYSRALLGQTKELPDLLPDLAYSVMLPYLGHQAAYRGVAALTAERKPGRPAAPAGPETHGGSDPARETSVSAPPP
jgi:AcrR family transcriptional regulator